jgi:zinc transporter 1/2/3
VIFHQLFEGLSLGIRIAALPPPHSKDKNPDHDTTRHNQRVNHSFWKKVLVRIGGGKRSGKALLLKCVLAISFAITTPAGMAIGMVAFEVGKKKEGIELGE